MNGGSNLVNNGIVNKIYKIIFLVNFKKLQQNIPKQ
jgi:hypothetical protein